MFKFYKKLKFSTTFFVGISLALFFGLAVIHFLGKIGADYIQIDRYVQDNKKDYDDNDRYFLKKTKTIKDPFITRNPELDEFLSGPIVDSHDPSMGDREAGVVIVYYSDFTCDFCQKQEQILKKIVEKYKYQVKIIWKDYPENDRSSISYRSAIAGRCAQSQDVFWPYHDFLYEFSDRLNNDTFLEIADILKLDRQKFEKCLNGEEPKKLINRNIEEADALNIIGIPFMYINDKDILGEIDFETLDEMVAYELNK